MEDPQYPVNIIAGQWSKIATNVTKGTIHRKTQCKCYQTFRKTGGIAPTLLSEGVKMFQEFKYEPIEAPEPIDAYVWPVINAILRVDV